MSNVLRRQFGDYTVVSVPTTINSQYACLVKYLDEQIDYRHGFHNEKECLRWATNAIREHKYALDALWNVAK